MSRPTPYYDRQRRKGRVYSAIFHLVLLLLAIFGLPSLLTEHPPEEPMAITLDIVPVSDMPSNIPQSSQKPAEEPKHEQPKPPEKAPEPPKPAEQHNTKETPPVQTAAPPPPPPPPPPEPIKQAPKPPEPPKPKPPEKPKPKPKPQVDPLEAVLKGVAAEAKKEKPQEQAPDKTETGSKTRSISQHYNPNLPMSLSEKDAIRSQIAKCWSVPAGVKDAQNLVVTLRIQLARDGTVTSVDLAGDRGRYNSDNAFQAATDSARRAVQECSPLKNLPPEKYETWRDMELTFDPKDMLL